MKTLYSKFVITTMLIMIGSLCIGFLMTNTYYHQVTKEKMMRKTLRLHKILPTILNQRKKWI